MSRLVDGDMKEHDYKSYFKTNYTEGEKFVTFTREKDAAGNKTGKIETGFAVGLKFIIGPEVKVQVEEPVKVRTDKNGL